MKVLVTSAPRSGTHFVVRSLGQSLDAPVVVKTSLANLPEESHWVIGTHDLNLIKTCHDDIVKVGIHREMLGHLLSYFDHPKDPNSSVFIDKVSRSKFFAAREAFLNLDAYYFSFDKLVKKDVTELSRMSDLFNVRIKIESYQSTVNAFDSQMFRHGDPDKWKAVFNKKTQNILIDMEKESK